MKTKTKRTRIVSPAAKLSYPYLQKPDIPPPQYAKANAPEGSYKTDFILSLDSDETKTLIAKLEEVRDTFREEFLAGIEDKKKRMEMSKYKVEPVYREELDDDGNPTGNAIFRAKQAKVIVSAKGRHEFSVVVVDAKKNKLSKAVYSGSIGKVAADAEGYMMASNKTFGVTLRLVAVQVLELKSGSDANVDDLFSEEDGFVDEAGDGGDDFSSAESEPNGNGDF